MELQPLTRNTKEGALYRRSEEVDQQIRSALGMAPDALVERARIDDKDNPDYLQEESLVYLIRESHRRGQQAMVNALAEILIERCASYIDVKLRSLGPEVTEDAFQDVISSMFDVILDLNSDRGDFLQVRFWRNLELRIINTFNRSVGQQRRAAKNVPLSSLAGQEIAPSDDESISTSSQEFRDTALTADELALCQDALNTVDEPYRTAFILHHYHGWPIESIDSTALTISRYFNKTPRTIRNWLAKAEGALLNWRNEE